MPGSSETTLVHRCLGPRVDAGAVRGSLQGGIDWEKALALARRHGVVAHLHRSLAAAEAPVLQEVLDALAAERRAQARRGAALAAEVVRLAGLLDRGGVPVLPLKGPALASAVYGDAGFRDYGDLDLLVRRSDLARTEALLGADGFLPIDEPGPLSELWYSRALGGLPPLVRPGRGIPVEVHGAVHPPSLGIPLEGPGLWERAVPTELGGESIACMSIEDTLLVICSHGSRSAWERLEWIASVAWIAEDPEVDWDLVTHLAGRAGVVRMTGLGLALASELAGARLSGSAQRLAALRAVRRLAPRVLERLDNGTSDGLRTLRFIDRERLRDRLRSRGALFGLRLYQFLVADGVRPGDGRQPPDDGRPALANPGARPEARVLTSALRALLPSDSQTLFLRACLPTGEPGRSAFALWRSQVADPAEALRDPVLVRSALLPLLLDAIRKNQVEADAALLSVLRAARAHEELRAARFQEACADVLERLDEPAIVLPGVALAATAYGDWPLRHCHDLDLLVRTAPGSRVHPSGVPVVRHTTVYLDRFHSPPLDEVWARAREVSVAGAPAQVLDPADALVHVCGQAASSGMRDLRWALDAWFLVAGSPPPNWQVVVEHATSAGLGPPVSMLLAWLAGELQAPVPDETLSALRGEAGLAGLAGEVALGHARRAAGTYAVLRQAGGGRSSVLRQLAIPSPEYLRLRGVSRAERLRGFVRAALRR